MTWDFVFRYSLQILSVAAGAALIVRVLAVRDAALRLRVWQAALLLMMALPWLQPATPVVRIPAQQVTAAVNGVSNSANRVLPSPVTVWAIGAAILLARLAVSGLALRSLRRTSIPHDDGLRLSDRVTSPVAFGFRRPVILLPLRALQMPPEAREPMLAHEQEHLRRLDWPQMLAEELCRALLWFHPAAWWLLARIRADREQAVDAAVASRLGPTRYAESLLAVAAWHAGAAAPALATTMFRGRSLAQRLQSLNQLQENTMTKQHKLGAIAAIAMTAVGVVVLSTSAAPLQGFPQESSKAIKVNVTKLKQTKKVTPAYPVEAKKEKIQGRVELDVLLNTEGKVSKVSVRTGPSQLVESAVEAVKQWEYEPVHLNGKPVDVQTVIFVNYTLAP